jgi:NAD(P)-dependent dehydrogenase (short-subunit alcohol dehydrogenase family)
MLNGLGVARTIVLFGGSSEIGRETLLELLSPGVSSIVLVSRDIEKVAQEDEMLLRKAPNADVFHVRFDGADALSMPDVVHEIVDLVGDVDVAIIAHALLGDEVDAFTDAAGVSEIITVNMTATMTLLYALSTQMRTQRHGRIALFSSVAGERVRKANAPYGASKAGIDAFALALDHELAGSGVSIVVIRPGYVHTKMTAKMKPAPFSTTAQIVGQKSARAIKGTSTVIWVPSVLRWIFVLLKMMPLKVWRRLPVHD